MNKARKLIKQLSKLKNPEKAKLLAGFFKTGKGEYGHGDIFWGIMVPQTRGVIKAFKDYQFSDKEYAELLNSKIHEVRLAGVFLLIELSKKDLEKAYKLYLKNIKRVNNWDLVDLSAPQIVGRYVSKHKNFDLYDKLVSSPNLWVRRISIVSTFWQINIIITSFDIGN